MTVTRTRANTMVINTSEKIPLKASFCRTLIRTLHSIVMGIEVTVGDRLENVSPSEVLYVLLTHRIRQHVHGAVEYQGDALKSD